MKTLRAISIGIGIWILGVSFYSMSFYFPILENSELQANLVLFFTVIPLVWFGTSIYYKSKDLTHSLGVGSVFLLVSAGLDALITVPIFMIPNGVSYSEFFFSFGFWTIASEFLLISTLYYYSKVKPVIQ